MNKYLTLFLIAAFASTVVYAQGQLDFDNPAIPGVIGMENSADVVSGHSVSLTVIGLEYSYEQRLGGYWSLVMRAGFPIAICDITTVTQQSEGNYSFSRTFNFGPRPGIVIEPRYYTNMERRFLKGKKTANNCADFVSLPIKAYSTHLEDIYFSLIPTYGIRRGSNHWFREYTFGVGFHSMGAILPHLNFRIGYTF
jgi:hypothetical protein